MPEVKEKKREVSIAVVLNTGGKTLEEMATFSVRTIEEPPRKADPENEPPMEMGYDRTTKRIVPVEPIDNGEHED